MSRNFDGELQNQSGASYRSENNDWAEDWLTNRAGAGVPSTITAYGTYFDTSSNNFMVRNASNNASQPIFNSDGYLKTRTGDASAPAHSFADDSTTGGYMPGPGTYAISANSTLGLSLNNSSLTLLQPTTVQSTNAYPMTLHRAVNSGSWAYGFTGLNSVGGTKVYGAISTVIQTNTSGAEDAYVAVNVMEAGTLTAHTLFKWDGSIVSGIVQITDTDGTLRYAAIGAGAATNGQVLRFNGSAWAPATVSGTGTIGGSGTSSFIPKFTNSSTLGNSVIQALADGIYVTGDVELSGQLFIGGDGSPSLPGLAGILTNKRLPVNLGGARLGNSVLYQNGYYLGLDSTSTLNWTTYGEPAAPLHIVQDGSGLFPKGIYIDVATTSFLTSGIAIRAAQGTSSSKSARSSQDAIGSFDVDGYNSTVGDYIYLGGLRTATEAAESGAYQRSQLTLWTHTGSSSGAKAGLIIDSKQQAGVGNGHIQVSAFFPVYALTSTLDIRVNGDTDAASIKISNAGSLTYPATYFVRTRGSHASPSAVQDADILGYFGFYGYQNSADRLTAEIIITADGAPSGNFVPGKYVIKLGTVAAIPSEKFSITNAGLVTVTGSQTISTTLGVTGITTMTGGSLIGNATALTFTVGGSTTTTQSFTNTDTAGVRSAIWSLHATAAGGPNIGLVKGRGTLASPTVVVDGDSIGTILAYAYDGTDYEIGGRLLFAVDGTPGSGDMPTRFRIDLCADGTTTLTTRLNISNAGVAAFTGSITCTTTIAATTALSCGTTLTIGTGLLTTAFSPRSVTISGGTFAVTSADLHVSIAAESGSADTLDTITGGTAGQHLYTSAAPLHTITITDTNGGNDDMESVAAPAMVGAITYHWVKTSSGWRRIS